MNPRSSALSSSCCANQISLEPGTRGDASIFAIHSSETTRIGTLPASFYCQLASLPFYARLRGPGAKTT